MTENRIKALKNIISMDYGTKYMTLSNNKEIGENLVEDLKTYFILLFKNKYKYNYRIWNKIEDKDTISNILSVCVSNLVGHITPPARGTHWYTNFFLFFSKNGNLHSPILLLLS